MLARRQFLALGVLPFMPQLGRDATPVPADLISDLVAGNHILTQEGILDGYGTSASGIRGTRIDSCSRAPWRLSL